MQLPTALKVQLTPVTCASLLYACEALLKEVAEARTSGLHRNKAQASLWN